MMISAVRVREALKKSGVDVDFEDLPLDMSFQENGVDSMDMMNIFLELEEAFWVKIPDEDVMQLDSIQSIIDYLQERLS
jgi:acyl carrier protein